MNIASDLFHGSGAPDQLEDEVACASRFDFQSRLHDAREHRWIRGWKPSLECWEIHAIPWPENPECNAYEGSFPISVKIHWQGESDIVEVFPSDFAEFWGRDFPQMEELRRAITGLPDNARARVTAAIARMANRIRAETQARTESEETLLDAFRGRVEKIEQGIAYVKFVDRDGAISYAQIAAADVAKEGIRESGAFICEIKARNGGTTMTLTPLPKRQLSTEDYAEIDRELDESLPDSVFDSDEK